MALVVSEVRTRLSAEGVDEVVRALRKVQDEALKSKSRTAAFKENMAVAGQAAALFGAGLTVLAKGALDAADALGKLAAKTGMSAESLSVLKVAAATADVEFEQLGSMLVKFNKFQGELARGGKDSVRVVKELFGSASALNGLSVDERFRKIAEAVGRMPPGVEKTNAALAIFGKSGADLIPLLNDLAEKGFGHFEEKARATGQYISTEFAQQAQDANDAITDLKTAAMGAATQLASGLAPALKSIAETSKEVVSEATGGEGFKKIGEVVGQIARGIVAAFLIVGRVISHQIQQVSNFIGLAADIGKAFWQTGGGLPFLAQLPMIVKERFGEAKSILVTEGGDLLAELDRLFNGSAGAPGRGGKPPDTETPDAGAPDGTPAKRKSQKLNYDQQIRDYRHYLEERKKAEEQAARGVSFADVGGMNPGQAEQPLAELEGGAALREDEDYLADAEAAERAALAHDEAAAAARRHELAVQAIGDAAAESLRGPLMDFFTRGIQESKSFGDALGNLARGVVNSLQQIAAQMLVNLAIKQLMRAVGGFSSGGIVGGDTVQAATGGFIRGPGTATSDSIPARLSDGEYVVRASAVSRPGIRDLLDAINYGGAAPAFRTPGRYAEGGLVSSSANGAGLNGALTVGLEEGLVAREVDRALSGPQGAKIVIKHLATNPNRANRALGGG